MLTSIKVYDQEVSNLLDTIDNICRKADAGKYGLPKNDNRLREAVYAWLYKNRDIDAARRNLDIKSVLECIVTAYQLNTVLWKAMKDVEKILSTKM